METLNDLAPFLPSHLQQGDFVALTFFLTTISLAGSAIFFFCQFFIAPSRWKNLILIMAMILLVAAWNYVHMQEYYIETQISPTEFRYFDWLLTVPLACTLFYLLVRPFGYPRARLWIMIASSLWMLLWGYYGEAIDRENSLWYGIVAFLGGVITIYQMSKGIAFAKDQPIKSLKHGYRIMFYSVAIFWTIYPMGYLTIPGNLLSNAFSPDTLDVIYNLGDIFNKVVFSMMLFILIIHPSYDYQEHVYGEYLKELEAYKASKRQQQQQQAGRTVTPSEPEEMGQEQLPAPIHNENEQAEEYV